MTFAKRLHELRNIKGYTQNDMARFLEMSQPGYSKIEYGQREISFEKLVVLSNIFSVSIDYLIKGNEVLSKDFGNRLKNLRKAAKLTQEDLAEKLEISSKSVISNYETNYSQPDFNTLVKIAKLFKVTTDYLLGYEVEK